ncbi:uncharacterized protein JN550_008415 [Neoarthrinium moseri]|uniref:uncharacterized protein n=1 Tax=Neoarthrinium moseri TaxID=1658444 RepID=UPI001FDCDC2A|nr:uncharacterized protein JN550_008415 [Neoarthrinium moseri]KAI1865367.1 hypothetical protein JN550_008415 [Neoarthrinium moseri]
MAPVTRSHDDFAAICTEKLPVQTLRDLFRYTKSSVTLVASQDFSVLLTDKAEDLSKLDSVEEFTDTSLGNYEDVERFLKLATQTTGIKTTGFVFLDRGTANDGTTCCITIDGRQDKNAASGWIGFRCDFASIVPALEALERGVSVVELRNQSAMAGGVWREDRVRVQLERTSPLDTSKFPRHDDWKPVFVDGPDLQYTVFRTAKISNQTLNKFLERAYDHEWSSAIDPRVAFITKLTPPFTDGLADPPLASAPGFAEDLCGAKPSDCDAIVRSCFMDNTLSPKLDRHRFIIMDEFTETDETVIMALNFERNGQLILVRSDFENGFLTLMAPGQTGSSMDSFADEASISPLGVWRAK